MTFADPRWPAQDQPFGELEEAELREFSDECRGDGGLELKLKLLQGLEHREAGARLNRLRFVCSRATSVLIGALPSAAARAGIGRCADRV